MDKRHIILSILLVLPFLGLEMSPVGNSWITSLIIWVIFVVLLSLYNKRLLAVAVRIRIKNPFYLSRSSLPTVKNNIEFNVTRLEYDNVLWEDGGDYVGGGIIVRGPFCPKDLTPLATKRGWDRNVDTELRDRDNYSEGGLPLFCLECKAEYYLNKDFKRLEQSRSEVRQLFEGIRRRRR